MKKLTLITSLLLKGCLFGDIAMGADVSSKDQMILAGLNKANLPMVKQSLLEYAKTGHANAQLAVAKLYESENNYEPSLVVEWYKKSAINGNAEAQFQLGLLYIDGEMMIENREEGMFWVEQAAEQGHERAKTVFESLEIEEFSFGC